MNARNFGQFLMLGSLGSLLAMGCQGEATKAVEQPAVTKVTLGSQPGPSVVELQKAIAVVDHDDIARLEIFYKFTSGSPTKHYVCKVRFPDVERDFSKTMFGTELSQEGSFKTAIEAGDPPPDSFEITLSEAESPDAGYEVISNTLTGKFQEPITQEGKIP